MDAGKLAAAGREAAAIDAEIAKPAAPEPKQTLTAAPSAPPAELPGGPEEIGLPADPDQDAREWGMVAYTIGQAAAMFAPQLRSVYSEEACAAWGATVVPVARKYGWSGPGSIPEIGLILSTASLAVPTFFALRARLAELDAERLAAERRQLTQAAQRPEPDAPPAKAQGRAPAADQAVPFTPAPLT